MAEFRTSISILNFFSVSETRGQSGTRFFVPSVGVTVAFGYIYMEMGRTKSIDQHSVNFFFVARPISSFLYLPFPMANAQFRLRAFLLAVLILSATAVHGIRLIPNELKGGEAKNDKKDVVRGLAASRGKETEKIASDLTGFMSMDYSPASKNNPIHN
ncbi:unnamed protein product [Victoria cruziana]